MSPFPSWSIQEEGNCAAFQSVVDLFLDPFNILWVLDNGVVDVLERPVNSCPPKIVAINAKTGKVSVLFFFKSGFSEFSMIFFFLNFQLLKSIDVSPLAPSSSRLQFLVADYSADGRVFVYISDASNRAILVFDITSSQGYRLILPKAVSQGCERRDVLYVNLVRRKSGDNVLLVSYLGGRNIYSIRTVHLQNGTAYGQLHDLGPKTDKIVFLGTDNSGAIYYRKLVEADVYRWNALDHTDGVQLVHRGNPFALPSQVVQDVKRGRMRILESNFPDFLGGTAGDGVNHSFNVF